MTVDTNSESTIKGKDNLIVGFILKYVEILLRIAVPTVATFYLIIQIIKPTSISIEVLLKFILFIVASLAISESINKYLTINGIKEKLDDIHKYDIPNQKLITSLNEAGIVDM
jgi:low affinity Fe/Cu permease